MNRRGFLSLTAASLFRLDTGPARAQTAAADTSRTFEITTHVHVQHASGITRVWLPAPLAVAPYQNTLGDTYHVDEGSVSMIEREGLDMLAAEWADGVEPIATLACRVATKARAVDLSAPTVEPPKDFSGFSHYLRIPKAAPLDEAPIKARAATVARGAGTDVDRARAIFDGIAGDIAQTADAHALYVAVARAAGLPARFVYGLSLAKPDATRAQTSRVEVYLVGFGWVPIDIRARQFGGWDSAWVAYNSAEDLVLPGAARGALPYFMHPQAETGGQRVNALDPDAFRYSIAVERA